MKSLALLLVAFPLAAQPQAPELTLDAGGRFEFARVPELALVRGIPQTVQLGFYQLDPTNPWPAGDVDRASGWESKRPTRLVDAATGQPVVTNIVTYDPVTAELKYAGTWSGDVTVRLKEIGGTAQSGDFRIRVLTPTVAYGKDVVAINAAEGWNARLCPSETTSFATCRGKFSGGTYDIAPLVVYIAPGTYGGQDWFLGSRRFTYVLGDGANRPTVAGDAFSGSKKEMFYVANLNMRDTNIYFTTELRGAPNTLIVRSVYQCCEAGDQNGIVNSNNPTGADLWSVFWHASESKGMGAPSNARHAAYVEGRPNSIFDVNNLRVLGTRASSAIKTTMNELNVRHSVFHVAESLEDLANGNCVHPGSSTGCLMHTPIDFPGFTSAVIYANRFEVWRGPTVGVYSGRWGVLAGAIFVRLRMPTLGSDVPNYPNVSWSPPVSSQTTKLSPCRNYDPGATTFVKDQFWKDVRSVDLADGSNPCTFKHFIGFNQFVQLPGSRSVPIVRDDGTYPAKVTAQFAVRMDILRNHALWVERSTNFMFGNTLEIPDGQQKYKLTENTPVRYIEPLSFWPRSEPSDFPRVVEVAGEELPSWFKL